MVAEFASPELSATSVDGCSQTETDAPKNIALIEPSAQQEVIQEHLGKVVDLSERDDQSLWASFEEMMNSLDATSAGEAKDITEAQAASTSAISHTSKAHLTLVSANLDTTETSELMEGQSLPLFPGSNDIDLASIPTWQEAVVALGSEIQRIRQSKGLSLD